MGGKGMTASKRSCLTHRNAERLAHEHGDGDLRLVATGGVDRAVAGRACFAHALAEQFGQVAQAAGAKRLRVLVAQFVHPVALHLPAVRREVGTQHGGDVFAVRGIGKQQVQAACLDVIVAQEVGHRVDLGAAQPFGWLEGVQLRRDARPVLFGVCLGQCSANGFCLQFTREAGQIGIEQAGADGTEKRVGNGHGKTPQAVGNSASRDTSTPLLSRTVEASRISISKGRSFGKVHDEPLQPRQWSRRAAPRPAEW